MEKATIQAVLLEQAILARYHQISPPLYPLEVIWGSLRENLEKKSGRYPQAGDHKGRPYRSPFHPNESTYD
jgi:hypothetical protein